MSHTPDTTPNHDFDNQMEYSSSNLLLKMIDADSLEQMIRDQRIIQLLIGTVGNRKVYTFYVIPEKFEETGRIEFTFEGPVYYVNDQDQTGSGCRGVMLDEEYGRKVVEDTKRIQRKLWWEKHFPLTVKLLHRLRG